MAANDAVNKARSLLEERRRELTAELAQIEQALAGLGSSRRRGPGRPRGSTATARSGKRRRRRRGGTRADHAVKHLEKNPGATASEIAKAMGIKPNYVYRVMSELEKDGRVRKEGKGYQLASAAPSG
jgi:predicted Rossmann fold nucleotide-binding protein DprA/Smf involved in DNA uptake